MRSTNSLWFTGNLAKFPAGCFSRCHPNNHWPVCVPLSQPCAMSWIWCKIYNFRLLNNLLEHVAVVILVLLLRTDMLAFCLIPFCCLPYVQLGIARCHVCGTPLPYKNNAAVNFCGKMPYAFSSSLVWDVQHVLCCVHPPVRVSCFLPGMVARGHLKQSVAWFRPWGCSRRHPDQIFF